MGFNKSILLTTILSVLFLIHINAQTSNDNFEVDQLLIRVQLKENESIEKSIKITNIGLSDIDVNIAVEGLNSIIEVDKYSVKLKSSSSESIALKISGLKEGVFIGKLILSSAQEIKEIPVVIEIESKNVLVDASVNPSIASKIYPGSRFSFDISLINLMETVSATVLVNYEIKDFDNNKILEESENIVVSKRASFIKNFKIPSNAKLTSYVLIAKVQYKDSFGTATHIFDVEKREMTNLFSDICKNNVICRAIVPLIVLIFLIIILVLLAEFIKKKRLFRKKLISPIKMQKISAEKAKIQEKLDSLVEAYKSGFITKKSYEKSRKKLIGIIKNLNKK